MRYFIMKQNTTLPFGIRLRDHSIDRGNYFLSEQETRRLEDTDLFYLTGEGDESRPDFIENPVMMISEAIKGILDLYEDDLAFRSAVLVHFDSKFQYPYYRIELPAVAAKSDTTEYYPDGSEKKLVLSRSKIGDHHLFLLDNTRIRHPIISLMAAESLLRRKVSGIIFEEVEVIEDGRRV